MLKPTTFPEANVTYAEHQDEYMSLPCYRSPAGECVSRWRPSFADRLRLLFGGVVWHTQLTFNQPMQPIMLMTTYPFNPATLQPRRPTPDDLEAKSRYDIDHKTIGSDPVDGRSAI